MELNFSTSKEKNVSQEMEKMTSMMSLRMSIGNEYDV